tara:strand:- start:977 stop:1246 length:270 start_codon:yes stop_codon:yes gene_type:complete
MELLGILFWPFIAGTEALTSFYASLGMSEGAFVAGVLTLAFIVNSLIVSVAVAFELRDRRAFEVIVKDHGHTVELVNSKITQEGVNKNG